MVKTNSIDLLEKIKAQKGNELIVFTTFAFDPLFFDSYLLRTIKDKNPKATILVLIDSKTYYQNMKEFTEETGDSYALIPIAGNLFHSKIFLFLSEKKSQVFLGSHNLTLAGLAHNLELSFESNSQNVIHDCVRYIHSLLEANHEPGSPPLKEINKFYNENIKNSVLIDNLEKPILDQVIDKISNEGKKISEVLIFAPFFSHVDKILDKINATLNPNPIKLCIQKNNHNLDAKNLGKFDNIRYFEINPVPNRRMHSKFIVFKSADTDHILIGSPNCTRPALLETKDDGNFESALLINKDFNEFMSNDLKIKPLSRDEIKVSQRETSYAKSFPVKNTIINFAYFTENHQLVIEYNSKIQKEIQIELLDSKMHKIESFSNMLEIGKHSLVLKTETEYLKSIKFTDGNEDISNSVRIYNPTKQRAQRTYDFSDEETIRNSIEQNLEVEEIIVQCNALFAYGREENFVENSGIKGKNVSYADYEPMPGRRRSQIPKKSVISLKIGKKLTSKKSHSRSKKTKHHKEKTIQERIHNYIEGVIDKFGEFISINNKEIVYLLYLNYSLKLLQKLKKDNQLGIKAVKIITGFDGMIRNGNNFEGIENSKKMEFLKILLELVLNANENLTQRHKFDENVIMGFKSIILDDLNNEIPVKNIVKEIKNLDKVKSISISDEHIIILQELYQQILLQIPLSQKNKVLTNITQKLIHEQNFDKDPELLNTIKFFIEKDSELLRYFEESISLIQNESVESTISRIVNEVKSF